MNMLLIYLLVGLLFYGIAVAEHRLHKSNYGFLKFVGGDEISCKALACFYGAYHLVFVVAFLEWLFTNTGYHPRPAAVGLSILASSLVIRYISFGALGRLWSKKLIFVPSFPRVKTGIYKYINHPEYLSRVLDAVGICLLLNAYITFIAFLSISIVLCYKIIPLEVNQLASLSRLEGTDGLMENVP